MPPHGAQQFSLLCVPNPQFEIAVSGRQLLPVRTADHTVGKNFLVLEVTQQPSSKGIPQRSVLSRLGAASVLPWAPGHLLKQTVYFNFVVRSSSPLVVSPNCSVPSFDVESNVLPSQLRRTLIP